MARCSADFNQLLSSVKGLTPGGWSSNSASSSTASTPSRTSHRLLCPARPPNCARPAVPRKKPLPLEEIHRQMLASGLLTSLPDPALDLDDDDP